MFDQALKGAITICNLQNKTPDVSIKEADDHAYAMHFCIDHG